jgi:hypothetical protein
MAPLINDVVLPVDMVIDLDGDDYCEQVLVPSANKENSRPCFGPLHHNSNKISPKQQRRVSFGGNDTTHEVLHRNDYTPEEITSTWFDRVDLRQMKDATKIEARLLEKGVLTEGDDVTVRGLESRTRHGAQRKRANKMNAYSAVFMELDTQFDLGLYDEDAIADVYYEYSEKCQAEAQTLAARDAKDVQQMTACTGTPL